MQGEERGARRDPHGRGSQAPRPERGRGAVAAGHPLSAQAGADALAAGGNAVDGAIAAMAASFVCEPLLTGLGAGGYMLIARPGEDPVLLDFFVEAPGRGVTPGDHAPLVPVAISFGDAVQEFNIGAASVGTYGVPAGVCAAAERFGTMPLAELFRAAIAHARDGVPLNRQQAYIVELLTGIVTATPESRAMFAPGGGVLGEGGVIRQPELADGLERLAAEGAAVFYTGEIGQAIVRWLAERGGLVTDEDLAAYAVIDRTPISAGYRGRTVLTNPPPSAGGILIAWALAELEREPGTPGPERLAAVMERAQRSRTTEFLDGLDDPSFVRRFLGSSPVAPPSGGGSPLGSTTHISVLDADGGACSVTCSAGSASGMIVPGTGVHLNNMLGEQDLNPLGFHRFPPGRRLPSMMAPTVVMAGGVPELVVGSAGSNRIRSAILQTIVRVLDDGLPAGAAVDAPRLHWEDDVVYAEPGIDLAPLRAAGREVVPFRERNLFFGGTQAAQRGVDGSLHGGGDPRRGGASVIVG